VGVFGQARFDQNPADTFRSVKKDLEALFMNFTRFYVLSGLLAISVGILPNTASAQVNSNAATVTLNATLGESIVISATPGTVNFTLVDGGTAAGSAPVAITTTWLVNSTRANVALYAWFGSPAAAMTDGLATPNNIPSSEFFGQCTTGLPTIYTAFTQSNTLGVSGGGLKIFTVALSSSNRSSSRTDNLNLEINLTAQPQLPAGSYTGTLNLQAQAL
jgi:hypothetical protein